MSAADFYLLAVAIAGAIWVIWWTIKKVSDWLYQRF